MAGKLDQLMDVCGFKKPGTPDMYKPWNEYVEDAASYAVRKTRPRDKKRALMMIGVYNLFIEFVAGRLSDTVDEASDGAVYMARAALEFRDRFIKAMMERDE